MKAIMISDHAKWCALMMNGIKNIEVRKNKALASAIQKLIDEYGYAEIYVYCTKDNQNLLDVGYADFFSPRFIVRKDHKNCSLNGKVVFKFRCYKVEEIINPYFTKNSFIAPYLIYEDLLKWSCLNENDLDKYLPKGKRGYAIHISDLEIFDEPKELSEFEKIGSYNNPTIKCPKKEQGRCNYGKSPFTGKWCGCEKARLTKAPQNMCYVEV